MEQITITYDNVSCCSCGVIFGFQSGLNAQRKESKATFYCPNGHAQSYIKSTADKLSEEIERKNRTISDRDLYIANLEKQVAKAKPPVRRKKRVSAKK